jgi:subtilase family serine protease
MATSASLKCSGSALHRRLTGVVLSSAFVAFPLQAQTTKLSSDLDAKVRKKLESNEANNAAVGNTIAIGIGPDLVVTSVSGPATAGTIGSITVNSTVQNLGTGNPPAFTVGFYLSTDAAITPADLRIGSRAIASLPAGQSDFGNVQLTIGAAVPPGTYFLGAIADDTGAVAEASESNNAFTGTPTIVPGPDLVVTSVAGPSVALTGGPLAATNTIRNVGQTDINTLFHVGIFLSTDSIVDTGDTLIWLRNVPGLAAGQSLTDVTVANPIPDMPNGTYYLGVIVDFQDAIAETDEANNTLVGNTVALSPTQITDVRRQGADILVSFTTLAGKNYRLEQTDTLSDTPVWNTVPARPALPEPAASSP